MYRLVVAALSASVLMAQEKQSPQELLKEAVTFQQQGKLDEAIRDYDLFLDMYPDAAEVRSNLAAALVGAGKFSQAITEYQLALMKKPDSRIRLNLAIAYYKAADFKSAADELKQYRDSDPTNVQAIMLLASVQLQLGDNKSVIELLTPLRRANPSDLGMAYLLGTALARDGQVAQAQIVINEIFQKGDSAEAHLLLGTAEVREHDYKAAMTDLQKAMEMKPDLPDVYAYYGMVLLVMGNAEASKNAFRKELERNPNNYDANLRLGSLLRIDQDYEHALPYIERALRLRPGDPAARYQVASIDLALGKLDQARGDLESLIKDEPEFTEAHVTLATIYYREKRKQDGDRERAIVRDLNAKKQAAEPASQQPVEKSK